MKDRTMSEQFHILGQIHAIHDAILFLQKKRKELQEELDKLEKKDQPTK